MMPLHGFVAICLGLVSGAVGAAPPTPSTDLPFKGKIEVRSRDSIPAWPAPRQAPSRAPNILVVLLDDIGFGDTSTFGGVAQTPELDQLAAQGLRYNNFHTTGMCSPTRAALLTGRNHHRVGFGMIADWPSGFPGYDSVWKQSTASIAEVLREHGYSTAAFGKWHNTPDWEILPTGPFERWPTGLGFDYFYGFMGPAGAENQWEPTKLYRNTAAVDPPRSASAGYHLTTDITDEAIRWVQTHESVASDKPYFLYFAPGAVHSPHHAPAEWIQRYRGKFDQGWDALNRDIFARQKKLGVVPANAMLTPRPAEVPAWESLTASQRQLYARQMEVYAGFIAHTDHEVGRLLQVVRSTADSDNTLILYIVGDNGAAGIGPVDGYTSGARTVQEQLRRADELGGPAVTFNYYSRGWAWAGNTPFRYWKSVASHLGSVRTPLVVSWPAHIKDKDGLRSQFTHVNDVAATLYEVSGITPPSVVNGVAQQPLDGVSFSATFDSAAVLSSHRTQYFEILGSRALYHDGWIATARHELPDKWWTATHDPDSDHVRDRWELYDLSTDFTEATDLSGKYPDKLTELKRLFDQEARKNFVYPLGASLSGNGKPTALAAKEHFVYYPGTGRIPVAAVPDLARRDYRMEADLTIPPDGAQGVIASIGDRTGGMSWYVKEGHAIFESRAGGRPSVLESRDPLPRGELTVAFEFIQDRAKAPGFGIGRLYVDGELTSEAALQMEKGSDAALYIGSAGSSSVSSAFSPPFAFSGTLHQLRLTLLEAPAISFQKNAAP
ncbi:arylsulfatase [Peristeroidobacter soli]|uniref:arylsulfatase n=1 Tax=Peristeroidobacter soli TaxID=2497877 RepID=UPI00101C9F54|nr:arylsulfatase [Peristeroidobacter soli]